MANRVINHRGFTLLETLLYLVIAGAVAVLLIQGTVLLTDMRTRHIVASSVSDEASLALRHVSEQVRRVAVVAPEPGESGSALTFADGVTIMIVDGALVHRTATQSIPLTSADVLVSGVRFENLGSGSIDIVRIELTVTFAAPASAPATLQYERMYVTSTQGYE
jgi:type II secretory pathway pseudopilin PulG